jgi:hypothetical protein
MNFAAGNALTDTIPAFQGIPGKTFFSDPGFRFILWNVSQISERGKL